MFAFWSVRKICRLKAKRNFQEWKYEQLPFQGIFCFDSVITVSPATRCCFTWFFSPNIFRLLARPFLKGNTFFDSGQWCTGSLFFYSNPAGYLDFLDLDWIGYLFPFNRIRIPIIQVKKFWPCKNLLWNNSCMRKNYDLSKSCTKNLLVWFLSIDCNVPHRSGS